MIVVEFRRPTLTAARYAVAATLRVDNGIPVIVGAPEVIPIHELVHTPAGLVSYQAAPESWAAHLEYTPWCPFVIPVIIAGTRAPATGPHHRPASTDTREIETLGELAGTLPEHLNCFARKGRVGSSPTSRTTQLNRETPFAEQVAVQVLSAISCWGW